MDKPTQLEKDCIKYFRGNRIFDRLLRGFREKFASYGYFAGTVVLRGVSAEEMEALEGFFQKSFHGQKSVSVSASRFERVLKDSRFRDISPKEVLELYFQEEMAGKRELKEARELEERRQWRQACEELAKRYEETPAAEWIGELARGEGTCYLYVWKRCQDDARTELGSAGNGLGAGCKIWVTLEFGARILNAFPYRKGEAEYLAVFAAALTGNPHAFDDGTREGQFLWQLVRWEGTRRTGDVGESSIFPALQKNRLYLAVGILRDDVSNDVMLSGILAYGTSGKSHAGMTGFLAEGEMVRVPLSVIAKWRRVACPQNEIYIVENPSVYAMLCGKWGSKRACMCMNGQPRLSAVLMLDLLAASGIKVYYGGDFDPEGLLIAWKVKRYYKGDFAYWHMSVEDYEKSRSQEKISLKRMKMLERIDDDELQETVETVRRAGVAGYQENIWETYR
jgi:uncharacterized protein (TIGR02679 family)